MKKRTKESLFAGAFLGSLAVLFYLRFGLSPEYIKVMGFSCILVVVGLIDFETYEIPDAFHVAAMGWWLLFHLIQGDSFFFGLVRELLTDCGYQPVFLCLLSLEINLHKRRPWVVEISSCFL